MPEPSPPAAITPHTPAPRDLPRRIGFWGAVAVMIGVIIGSGIFKTPVSVAQQLADPWLILALWVVGGLLALFGGLTYAELTTRYPQSGGLYVFLREGFGSAGRPLAFTFGWTYMLITKPFAAAGIMVPGAEHILMLAGAAGADGSVPRWMTAALTTLLLVGFTAVNIPGVKPGTRLAMVLTVIKFGALGLLVLLAVALMKGRAENFVPTGTLGPKATSLVSALGACMATILWAYDGWADVGSIAGEVERPRRSLPRIFLTGVFACTALYLAVNAVFIWMVPLGEMARSETIGPLVAQRLVGPVGAAAVTVLIIISTLGSSHASIITGARVTFAQARDGLLFRSLGRIHPRYQTPDVALWVQCILSIAAVWLMGGSFQRLADGFVFTMWIFYGLAGIALLRIRGLGSAAFRAPAPDAADGGEPFRCPGYPWVPLLFILSAAAMTALTVAGNPWQTLPWLGVLVIGWPLYYAWHAVVGKAGRDDEMR